MGDLCRVCGEPTTEFSHAVCSRCDLPFHLALRQDVPAKDCGQVWINPLHLGLEFGCNVCLGIEAAAAAPNSGSAEAAPRRRYTRHQGVRAQELLRRRGRRPGASP
ncbi:MAG: hypothetical protein C4290_07965 [Chloroflexota bacterium]